MKKEAKDSGEEGVQYPKTRGAYLVMTAARELREEGYDEGFAIIALGHALFAEERLEPVHGVPGTLWGSQRKQQRLRRTVEATTERRRESVPHRHTHARRQLGSKPPPAIHHVLHKKTFLLLLCCVTRSCPPPTRRLPVRVYVSLPMIQVSSSWGMTNCTTGRRSRRSARTSGGNSRPGIRGWRISGSLHELAACSGTKLVQAFTSGVAQGGQPSHTTCTVHGPGVSCSRLGEAVGTASEITSGLSNTGSSIEFGVPACQPLQRIRPPQGWSAVHAIGVAAPEGSAGGEDPRSRRAAVH